MNNKHETIFQDFRKLSIKDIMFLSECSESTAKRIKKNIIKEFNIKKSLLYIHYKMYYCDIV
ncbi:hypothetical protein BCF58_2385 [Chryseobacterium defluvii]|uniref:Uncharacterized protein n=1 Tax=Chryseobacterium defluvii TaxID=160396 RepID=A0A495SEB2_9FLAO|nr:hypothetical protein BCF58_2385 [Chryseobacterium defluvii]